MSEENRNDITDPSPQPQAGNEPADVADSTASDLAPESPANEGVARRDVLKALASVPVLGLFFAGWYKRKVGEDARHEAIMAELGFDEEAPAYIPEAISRPPSQLIRLGIIGFGGEGDSPRCATSSTCERNGLSWRLPMRSDPVRDTADVSPRDTAATRRCWRATTWTRS
jgi:hypothetical protein